jgi:hypothetical protein
MILSLLSACVGNPPPDCPSPIPSQISPSSMEEVIWDDDGQCVDVTYDPVLRDREQEVIDAANAWTAIPCGKTCFAAPVERATPEDGTPALYSIQFTALTDPGQAESTTQLWYRMESGTMNRALVKIDPSLPPDRFRLAGLRGFGRAIGFVEPPAEIESVLHPTSSLTDLSADDRNSYCAKYGVCLVSEARR